MTLSNELPACNIYNVTNGDLVIKDAMLLVRSDDMRLGFQFWPKLSITDAMTFFFNEESIRSMHMRNVTFPLLMTWLNKDSVIISQVLAQPSNTQLYSSVLPASLCIESHPDLLERLHVGDKLSIVRSK